MKPKVKIKITDVSKTIYGGNWIPLVINDALTGVSYINWKIKSQNYLKAACDVNGIRKIKDGTVTCCLDYDYCKKCKHFDKNKFEMLKELDK